MLNDSRTQSPAQSEVFGLPWPELNDGLFYKDVVPPSDSELSLIEFYSSKYKNSAPLQGWLQRIQNGQIALNKPSGLQVLPGGLFQQRTVLTQLSWRLRTQNRSLANQESQAVPVHRLGRGTSGILLCAKTKVAKTRFAAYFADGTSLVGVNRY
ncbi:Pseudouridine synthase, RsuA/RluB/C/D/E/F [Corchorus olitorius]|uniref:Pseudouridine synthase, RsuA/RluB/C/D/E/F n=1 Tax=Corchorus olitorius TaxID=93759 RepID=A0A1R3IF10_9ROSI|nr:Pseudouridine synthase, RsuA/RluB/C/D/E/F [Corchorus olitorius]